MPWANLHTLVREESPVVVVKDDRPTSSWNKAEIAGWLAANGVDFSSDETKAELLERVSEV